MARTQRVVGPHGTDVTVLHDGPADQIRTVRHRNVRRDVDRALLQRLARIPAGNAHEAEFDLRCRALKPGQKPGQDDEAVKVDQTDPEQASAGERVESFNLRRCGLQLAESG